MIRMVFGFTEIRLDAGTFRALGQSRSADGPFSDSAAAAFDGTSSYLDMYSWNVGPTSDGQQTLGLWFRTTTVSQRLAR